MKWISTLTSEAGEPTMKTKYFAVITLLIAILFPAATFGLSITQQAYIKASNTDADDFFGAPAAISGDTLVVAAVGEASSATGVNGNQSDNSAPYAGAAYVFVRSGTNWTQQAYLKASNTEEGDWFTSVAIDGDTIVVGALGESSNATGVNGNQSDNSAPYAGAVYVFVRNGTTWTQQAYLKASNTEAEDEFGSGLAIDGDTIVVGAPLESSSATGVNGNQSDNSAQFSGAAYVFVRNGTNWTLYFVKTRMHRRNTVLHPYLTSSGY
jgi:FG-GAP repeat